jgi:multicomponent Na+:H+ antiporter subunit F
MRSDLSPFLAWSIEITFILLLVSMVIALARLVQGPSLPDRIVALDLLTLLAVGVIALFAIREDKPVFLDAAIALALVAFLGTVAYARFLERRDRYLAKTDNPSLAETRERNR